MAEQSESAAGTSPAMSAFELWYGRDEPPPERTMLRAGSIKAYLEGADLRDLRFGGVELVRRLYFALRDENWDTIPGRIENLAVDVRRDSFQVSFDSHHRHRDIDFRWHGVIRGDASSNLSYTLGGTANSAFRYCRIGFCILHPPVEYAGQPFAGHTPGGLVTGRLPTLVGPQRYEGGLYFPLFDAVSSLTVSLACGVEAQFDFVGDLFEMEDQRNWTDGSFKTYCTPLALGYPHTAAAGQAFAQRVSVTATGRPQARAALDEHVTLSLGESLAANFPRIGLGMATHDGALTPADKELLRAIHPDHLRVDLHGADPDFTGQLARAEREANALGCGLELALVLTDNADQELDRLASRLPPAAEVARVLVFYQSEPVTSGEWVERVRAKIGRRLPGVPIGGGTNLYFAELNRSRPSPAGLDAVAYSINPQVHAGDERSLVENLEAQRDTVVTTRSFCGDAPIAVSPVTLKPRFNPDAVGPEPVAGLGELPAAVDPRQMSLFAAAWTVGSIKQLAEGGADSVTYYETTGWRGIKETENGSPEPELFRSRPGQVFPVYHVFADIGALKGARLVDCASTDPLRVQALALRQDENVCLLVANLTVEKQTCMAGPIDADQVWLRTLDAGTAAAAMAQPGEFRAHRVRVPVFASRLKLTLEPYSVTRIDIESHK